jgi:hypothetical protein
VPDIVISPDLPGRIIAINGPEKTDEGPEKTDEGPEKTDNPCVNYCTVRKKPT